MATYCIATSWDEGSVSRHFRATAEALARRGHRVLLLINPRPEESVPRDANPAVRVWPSPRPVHLADARWFAALAARERPRVLVANFGATNIMLTVGAALRVPVRVAWYHTLVRQMLLDGAARDWRLRPRQWRKRMVYRLATHFATASEAARADLAATYDVAPGKITRLGLSLADPVAERGIRGGHDGGDACIVCVGRLHPSKGQDVLLRALALLPERVRLVLVGDGPSADDYRALAARLGVAARCTFAGLAPMDRVLSYMADAALTVVPSRDEAYGLVNIESLSVGTPVVASAVGGITEIVRHGVEGMLVPPDDPPALARAIHDVLCTPGVRDGMAAAARRGFLDRFEQRAVAERQAEWLESL